MIADASTTAGGPAAPGADSLSAPAVPSKVYFTNLRTYARESQLDKLKRLVERAGIGQIDFENKFVAIKIHFGEPGNLSYLRPQYAKVVADVVKSLGGKPFLTDCNTLYVGGRKNALDHLDSAMANGFSPLTTGCQNVIADGLKGTDEVEVPVEGGEYVQSAKIGRAVMDADIFISLTHFKGHEQAGYGGALKNIGMGCGSRAGKMEQHAAGKPAVDVDACIGCRMCERVCAHGAISFDATAERRTASGRVRTVHLAAIDAGKCVGCGRCIGMCNQDAIEPMYDQAAEVLNYKIAEYTKAVLQGRPSFHVALAIDISPNCDCHAERTTRPSSVTSACSRASTRSRSTRRASTPCRRCPRFPAASSPTRRPPTPTTSGCTTTSTWCTPTPTGRAASRMPRRSVWARAPTSSSR